MTAPLKDNWQLAGFMLHADDDHYVKYDVVADNAPGRAAACAASSCATRTAAA